MSNLDNFGQAFPDIATNVVGFISPVLNFLTSGDPTNLASGVGIQVTLLAPIFAIILKIGDLFGFNLDFSSITSPGSSLHPDGFPVWKIRLVLLDFFVILSDLFKTRVEKALESAYEMKDETDKEFIKKLRTIVSSLILLLFADVLDAVAVNWRGDIIKGHGIELNLDSKLNIQIVNFAEFMDIVERGLLLLKPILSLLQGLAKPLEDLINTLIVMTPLGKVFLNWNKMQENSNFILDIGYVMLVLKSGIEAVDNFFKEFLHKEKGLPLPDKVKTLIKIGTPIAKYLILLVFHDTLLLPNS